MSDRLDLLPRPVTPSRRRASLVGLVVLGLLVAALLFGTRERGPSTADSELIRLQAAAALAACPTGLGKGLPALDLPCLGGGPDVRLDRPARGPMLVNIWGTWCSPCVREVPLLVDFARRASGRVGVVGVLTEDTRRNGLVFAQQFGITYANVVDDLAKVRGRFGAGAPLTLFVDAGGEVTYVQSGELTSAAALDDLVSAHLGVRL